MILNADDAVAWLNSRDEWSARKLRTSSADKCFVRVDVRHDGVKTKARDRDFLGAVNAIVRKLSDPNIDEEKRG